LNRIQRLQGLSEGLGYGIDFAASHDVRGNISASCDCRYGFSGGHNYRVDLQEIMLGGRVLIWP